MNFKKANEWDGIDLLILSHLHKDHVNGLDKLFNEYEVNQVILPYFSPEERLFIALRNINKQDWYYRFLSDPVEFFIEEKKVEKVIIITGRDEGEGEEDDDNQFDDDFSPEEKEYEETKDKIDLNRMPDDDSNISENENWGKYKKDGKLFIKKHNRYATVFGLWIFRFFNYKVSKANLKDFRKCLFKTIENLKGEYETGNLTHDYSEKIKEVIKNKEDREKLKKCYNLFERNLKDFNNTSLILYHGPVRKSHLSRVSSFYRCLRSCAYSYCCRCCENGSIFIPHSEDVNQVGQFLTGDVNLNVRYEEIKKHYKNYLNNVLVGQVPHHGSKYNWNDKLLNDTPNSKIWVVSAGILYEKHPSKKVRCDIKKNKKLIIANEIKCFSMDFFYSI
jgi:hypothetical protein